MIIGLPNILTLFRVLLVPVFIALVLDGRLYWAAIVFLLASITDAVDGFIARRFDLMTPLGAIMDPVADKLLLTSAYLVLAYEGLVPAWLFFVIIFRDLVMPTYLGKFTTVLQVTTVIYAIVISVRFGAGPLFALSIATAIVTVYSAVDYSIRELKKQSIIP
jgi:cardiolipin synthase